MHQGWQVLPVPHWEFEGAPNRHKYLMDGLAALVDVHGRAYRMLGLCAKATLIWHFPTLIQHVPT
eukprot:6439857-Prymnesium_polylepis.1